MKKSTPLVSLVIRTKNEERWISSCLDEVFKQSYKNFEVIIVDNESSDKTVEIAKQYPIKKITYISIHNVLLKLIKDPYFTAYYRKSPKNINEIKSMVNIVNKYLVKYLINKKYEKY